MSAMPLFIVEVTKLYKQQKNPTTRRLLAREKLEQKTPKSNSASHKVQPLNKNEMFTVDPFYQSKQRKFLCRI